jgi:hypothetical protein
MDDLMFHNGCLPTRAKAETVAARGAAGKLGYNQPNGTFVQKIWLKYCGGRLRKS